MGAFKDLQSVNRSNLVKGIVVGIEGEQSVLVIPEWKRMGKVIKTSDVQPQRIAVSNILCGINVPIDELLTHFSNQVRQAARARVEVKGADAFF